jgi:hypothetical protein
VRIAKKQNSAFRFKAAVSIVDNALSCGHANFIKVLSTIKAGCITIVLYLEDIETF